MSDSYIFLMIWVIFLTESKQQSSYYVVFNINTINHQYNSMWCKNNLFFMADFNKKLVCIPIFLASRKVASYFVSTSHHDSYYANIKSLLIFFTRDKLNVFLFVLQLMIRDYLGTCRSPWLNGIALDSQSKGCMWIPLGTLTTLCLMQGT